jgi:DNA-binding NarL/FixJ family response regulator
MSQGMLTAQEKVICELLMEGLTNSQIAERSGRSEYVVNFHLRNIYRKLGARSRTEAVVFCLKRRGTVFR